MHFCFCFSTDSYSLWVFVTSIKGQTPFPQLSGTLLLDDVTVGYYDGDTNTFIAKGNTTNEDSLIDINAVIRVIDFIELEWTILQSLNTTKGKLCIFFFFKRKI